MARYPPGTRLLKAGSVRPHYGEWVSYGGAARIWLAVVLLAAAAGLASAGIWLPLPGRAARSSRAALIATLAAWVASIAAWLACFAIYVRQYLHEYHIALAKAAPPDHVAPVTFLAVAAVFIIIVSRSSAGGGTRLASAAIGAIAAPLIFELPFDLIVWRGPILRFRPTQPCTERCSSYRCS